MTYVGRFAPSPTGPLHAGSIATAVASYIHAKQHGGRWLLRIDDIDPPRSVPGSAEGIVELLESLALHWDERVFLQSERRAAHAAAASSLLAEDLAFRCDCSRSELQAKQRQGPLGIHYSGHCRSRHVAAEDAAIRVKVSEGLVTFDDRLQGPQHTDLSEAIGDYVVFRRDALPAYHLAAVLDDAEQGVTDIVRGCDLLAVTAIHVHLAQLLDLPVAQYWHVPVLCDVNGRKLSKSHQAAAVGDRSAPEIALEALRNIGAEPPTELAGAAPETLWSWAVENWQIEKLSGVTQRPFARGQSLAP